MRESSLHVVCITLSTAAAHLSNYFYSFPLSQNVFSVFFLFFFSFDKILTVTLTVKATIKKQKQVLLILGSKKVPKVVFSPLLRSFEISRQKRAGAAHILHTFRTLYRIQNDLIY